MADKKKLKAMGVVLDGQVAYDRSAIASHAANLAATVRRGLEGSLTALGVDLIPECGTLTAEPNKVLAGSRLISAKNVILAPGSVPFVPKGLTVDEQTVFTSDGALKLERVPQWLAIIGSGYIGLEFSDVFTALGTEVTFVEAMSTLMPTFDPEIAKVAERLLIRPRKIDSRTGVFAAEITPGIPGKEPVRIKLVDAVTKQFKEEMVVDACLIATGRAPNTRRLNIDALGVDLGPNGAVPVDANMRVVGRDGSAISGLYCIGDANGKMMLAHAASAQGMSAVEHMCGHPRPLNHDHIPAACFTHPEIAFVGLNEEQAKARGLKEGFEVGKAVSHFRANSKALAELSADGIVKILFRKDTGELLGAHIVGLHAADLIQSAANAMAARSTVRDLAFMVHAHPTLSEVLDAAWKSAVGVASH
eukprot:Selendium_serpulae@DN5823_c0_g1_i1.p1